MSSKPTRPNFPITCIGYNVTGGEDDEKAIAYYVVARKIFKDLARSYQLIRKLQLLAPQFGTAAEGTIIDAGIDPKADLCIGVSATLWKGTSGGPCMMVDGKNVSRIIGKG